MSGSAEHAADEAAGEVIYTSDGREPPIVMSPPPLKKPEINYDDDKAALLETTGLSAEEAFEVFAGKIYPMTNKAPRPAAGRVETPWQRLARLQQEAQELEKDLAPTAGGGNSAEDTALLEAVRLLQTRLSQPSTVSAASSSAWQERLTQQLSDSSSALKRITSASSFEGSTAAGATTTTSTTDIAAAAAADWEARIRKLEKLVGMGAGAHESHSLLERLAVLERAASKFNEKDLEAAMKKAKVIRQDLEAASKARNKLLSSRDANAESSKSIADLHDQMTQLQGLTNFLPVLAQRLQALAVQHSQATTWTQRLASTEQQASQLETATKKMDDSLKKLEESLQASAEQMIENMKALDAKLS